MCIITYAFPSFISTWNVYIGFAKLPVTYCFYITAESVIYYQILIFMSFCWVAGRLLFIFAEYESQNTVCRRNQVFGVEAFQDSIRPWLFIEAGPNVRWRSVRERIYAPYEDHVPRVYEDERRLFDIKP